VSVEAASPELIERARTVVTDGTGHYRIVDLRPGTYSVTFTFGFNSVRHEGITVTGSLTATLNADLKTGAVDETITIAHDSALADVQSVTRQTTVSNEILNAVPSAKSYAGLMILVPAIVAAGTDSQVTPRMLGFSGSGGRDGEGRLQVDGLNTGFGGNGASPYVADVQNAAEVSFTTSGGLGEKEVGGPIVSVVPRTGGNRTKGSFYAAGVSANMVGTNYTQSLKDAGLTVPDALLNLWDINIAAGGPVQKDRVWYFVAARDQGSSRSVAGMYANANAGDPNKWTYVADLTRPAETAGSWTIGNARLTMQVSPRNKINLFWDEQLFCGGAPWSATVDGCRQQAVDGRIIAGPAGGNGIAPPATAINAPETATYVRRGTPQRVQQVTWQAPRTDRLLLEAAFGTFLLRGGGQEIPGNPTRDMVRVTEQCSAGCANNGNIQGLMYRSNNWASNWTGNHNWRASASYVTGAQSIKVGYQGGYLVADSQSFTNSQNLAFRFNNGVPNQLTELLLPFETRERARYDGVYVQEQWTHRRLTLQGALRFDRAWSWFPPQQIGPTRFLPTAAVFDEAKGVDSYKDLTPRLGAAYDLFGNGKTSIKVNLGKYLEAARTGSGAYSGTRPSARIVTSITRGWTDRNGNYVPDCDLDNPFAQSSTVDFCGQISNLSFGQPVFDTTYDPALLNGWGVRPGDWGFGASLQHEVLPRVSVEVGYFRRGLTNFIVTDNRAQSPDDFGVFSVTAPLDPRLPAGGGYTVSTLYNANPNVASLVDNYVTLASNYGYMSQHYDGMLLNVSARPRSSVVFQGGINGGNIVRDACEIRPLLPELTLPFFTGTVDPFCHNRTGWVTRFTGLGAYTIPRIDVQIAGTFRTEQGSGLLANWAVANDVVRQSLGRDLSNNAPNVTVNLIDPGTLYGDRVTEVDLRFAKIFRFGRTRTNVGLDLNNVFNSAPVLSYNTRYVERGPWLTPTAVLQPRYLKISAQVDF
jgi:Carboxypeptidase regulatory-like domain